MTKEQVERYNSKLKFKSVEVRQLKDILTPEQIEQRRQTVLRKIKYFEDQFDVRVVTGSRIHNLS